jgi:hypothetical protein
MNRSQSASSERQPAGQASALTPYQITALHSKALRLIKRSIHFGQNRKFLAGYRQLAGRDAAVAAWRRGSDSGCLVRRCPDQGGRKCRIRLNAQIRSGKEKE